MSTAAAPRRPSPATMPARRRTASAADRALIAPGTPAPGTAYRALYEQAILGSRMGDNHRYVGLALAIHADADGQIPPGGQPRLVGLVHDTGLAAGQVVVALNALRQRGWIQKKDHRAPYETADLVLTIPARIMARLLKPTTPTTHGTDH